MNEMFDKVRHLQDPLKNTLSKEGTIHFPDIKQYLRKIPLISFIFQAFVLITNIPMNVFVCWNFFGFFFIKNNPIDSSTISFGNTNGIDVLACLPDIDTEWTRWLALIPTGIFAVIDLFSSLTKLKTLIESFFGSSCCKIFSFNKLYSPTYSFFVAFQSLWLQQVSLICANSNPLRSIFNFTSVVPVIQSGTIIICVVSSIWLRIAESGLCCCIDRSSKERLRTVLKCISSIFQIANFVISLIIWIENVKDMPFELSWTNWFSLIVSPIWLLMKIIKNIMNIFAHKQEELKEVGSADQRNTSGIPIEMTEFGNQNQHREERDESQGVYYPIQQWTSHVKDLQGMEKAGRRFLDSNWSPLSYNKNL